MCTLLPHTYTQTYRHARMHIRTYIPTYIHACVHTCWINVVYWVRIHGFIQTAVYPIEFGSKETFIQRCFLREPEGTRGNQTTQHVLNKKKGKDPSAIIFRKAAENTLKLKQVICLGLI